MDTQIVLIRHGETEWSRTGQHTGRTDIELTTNGIAEAKLIAPTLDAWAFAHVISSPLSRALTTAQQSGLSQNIEIMESVLEWDYGEYEGLTNDQIVAVEPGWSKWTGNLPGGEDVSDVGERADAAITTLAERAVDGPVCVFAHGHLLAILIARWLGMPAAEGRRFVLNTATASVLGTKRDDRVLKLFNHRCGAAAIVSDAPTE